MNVFDIGQIDVTKDGGESIFVTNKSMASNKVFQYWEILLETDQAVKYEYTRNGTEWFILNDDTTLKANNGYMFYLTAQQSDIFNLRPQTGTGVVIKGMVRGVLFD